MKMLLPLIRKTPIGKAFLQKKTRGFTLVELLVVISIIAILSVIGLTLFTGISARARDAKRRADGDAIAKALELYYNTNGSYPNPGPTSGSSVGGYWVDSSQSDTWIPGLSTYFASGTVPKSPSKNTCCFNGTGYSYAYYSYGGDAYIGIPQGQWYMLLIKLESQTSEDKATHCKVPGTAGDFIYPSYTFTRMWCSQQGGK